MGSERGVGKPSWRERILNRITPDVTDSWSAGWPTEHFVEEKPVKRTPPPPKPQQEQA